jgi:hypothetical protein
MSACAPVRIAASFKPIFTSWRRHSASVIDPARNLSVCATQISAPVQVGAVDKVGEDEPALAGTTSNGTVFRASSSAIRTSVVQRGEIIVAWFNPSLRPWGPRRQFWQVRFIDSGQDRLYQTTTTVRSGSPTAERLTECAEASEEVRGVARFLPI